MSTWSDVGRAELGEKEAAHGVDTRIGQLAKDAKAYDRSTNAGAATLARSETQTLTMSDAESNGGATSRSRFGSSRDSKLLMSFFLRSTRVRTFISLHFEEIFPNSYDAPRSFSLATFTPSLRVGA